MPRASTSLTKGVSRTTATVTYYDYDVLTEMTSFERGYVGRLGNLAARILGRKLDLARTSNSSVESNLWENSPVDQGNNSFRQKTPPPNSGGNGILTSKQGTKGYYEGSSRSGSPSPPPPSGN